jgi:hypothetical protein
MKLNLLPTYVGKERQTKLAAVVAVLIAALGIAAAVWMVITPQQRLERVTEHVNAERATYNNLVQLSAKADEIISKAQVIIRNINLADAMRQHTYEYPAVYDEIKQYIPSFFRVNQMSAEASDAGVSVVTLTGVIRTYQQYADLVLALLKDPNVVSVTRSGFQNTDPYVPELSPVDQTGRPIKPGEDPIPDDPLARLDYYIARGRTTGFTGTGGFGTDDTGGRGAMPEWSQVTLTVVIRKNLLTPNPTATLIGGR